MQPQGETLEEACANLQDAFQRSLACLRDRPVTGAFPGTGRRRISPSVASAASWAFPRRRLYPSLCAAYSVPSSASFSFFASSSRRKAMGNSSSIWLRSLSAQGIISLSNLSRVSGPEGWRCWSQLQKRQASRKLTKFTHFCAMLGRAT